MSPRPFDPLTLELFVAVCEEGNIGRAAARAALVPSAVSKRIGAIEAQVGTPLLLRGRRGVLPTDAGRTLLRQARELLGVMARMQAELGDYAAGAQGHVRVVASVSALAEGLPDDIAAFLAAHPTLRLSLDEQLGRAAVQAVREGAADLAVTWDLVDTGGLRTAPYRRDRLVVLMPPDHPLARRPPGRPLRFADTLDHPSIGLSPGGLMDTLLKRQAAALGRELVHRIQAASLDAGARLAAAGLGLAILPGEAAAPWLAGRRLRLEPLAEPWAERRFVVIGRDDEALPLAARRLREHLVAQAAASADPAEPAGLPGRFGRVGPGGRVGHD